MAKAGGGLQIFDLPFEPFAVCLDVVARHEQVVNVPASTENFPLITSHRATFDVDPFLQMVQLFLEVAQRRQHASLGISASACRRVHLQQRVDVGVDGQEDGHHQRGRREDHIAD